MTEFNEELGESGLSRRDMLKRMAAGTAIAWATPIVSTFRTPAFAQQVVSPAQCVQWDCGDPVQICGQSNCPLTDCLCDVDTEGNQVCWNNTFCSDSPPCNTSADCPAGWKCTSNCCGQTCLPPCGTCAGGGVVVQGAATAAGN